MQFSLTIVLAAAAVYAWYGSAWSERLWTWINAMLPGGAEPGLASDLEFLTVSLCAGAGACLIARMARRAFWKVAAEHKES